jgi:hypothetical protein
MAPAIFREQQELWRPALKVTTAIRHGEFLAVAVDRPREVIEVRATLTGQMRIFAPMGDQYSQRRMRH